MSNFSIEYLTSSSCGKGRVSPPLLLTPPHSESGSPPDSKIQTVSPEIEKQTVTAPEVEAQSGLSPETEVSLNGSIHALQIQANKLRINRKTKAKHSYIALISEAILNHPSRRLLLSEIYQYISDKYPQFDGQDKSWKNNIRHNLSLNQCFVKVGRCERGHYWSIHPAVIGEFSRGDFTRRLARRRVRRHLAEEQELEFVTSSYYSPLNSNAYPFHRHHDGALSSPLSGLQRSPSSSVHHNSSAESARPTDSPSTSRSGDRQESVSSPLDLYRSYPSSISAHQCSPLRLFRSAPSADAPLSPRLPTFPDSALLQLVPPGHLPADYSASALYLQQYQQMLHNLTGGLATYNYYMSQW